jgi:hypothetical protein
MEKIKWDTQKQYPHIASVIGEDGELYISYEGGTPVRARNLLDLYYDYMKKGQIHRWLTEIEQKEVRGWREWFTSLEGRKENL